MSFLIWKWYRVTKIDRFFETDIFSSENWLAYEKNSLVTKMNNYCTFNTVDLGAIGSD